VKPRRLTLQQLESLLDDLAQRTRLFAPCRVEDRIEFCQIQSHRELDRGYLAGSQTPKDGVNTRLPAKPALFPQCETILRFTNDGSATAPDLPQEQVWFGVRPCDAAGLSFLRKFFTQSDPVDPYVRERGEKTTVIGLACNSPADTCFCLALGGSPAGTAGMDILLTALTPDLRFLAEPLTAKGEAHLRDMPEATAQDLAEKTALAQKAAAAIPTRIDTAALKQKLAGADDTIWEGLCLPCVNCGVCTFLCPTCHCFDITDTKTCRIRVWDSCQFTLYSQHASGHNPRLAPRSRYRNRVMDKFCYTVEQVGEISCTGCGRCIRSCPASIDIRQTVAAILNATSGPRTGHHPSETR
jgi:ferredoxin